MQTPDPTKPRLAPPPHPRGTNSSRTIDGISRQTSNNRRADAQPQPLPLTGARFTKLQAYPRRRRRHDVWLAIFVSPVLVVCSALSLFGLAAALLYGVVAFTLKLRSSVTFVLALAAFIYMFSLQILNVASWAQTMSVIAYILLGVGAISLALETRRSQVLWSKKQ